MFSRVSMSWKVVGLMMVGCLALGMMLGSMVPKEVEVVSSEPQPETMLRGTVERRLIEEEEEWFPEEEGKHVLHDEELLPPAPRLDERYPGSPGEIVWPGESKAEGHGTGLWGSDEDDVWGDMEKLWARQEIDKVWGAGFAEESEGDDDEEADPFFAFGSSATSGFSYLWSEPMTNDFSYLMDDGMTHGFSMLF